MSNPLPPQQETDKQPETRVFTQADIDRIVETRLAEEGRRGRNEGREEGKKQLTDKLGVPLEEALDIIYKAKNPTATSSTPAASAPVSTDTPPAWAKGILSKVEQLEQQLAQTSSEKKRLEVQSKASQAGVFPELLDLLDVNSEDVDSAIQTLLDKQKAIVETRVPTPAKKPAPPTLHGASSQPLTAPPEQDILDRETALKIKRGGSR